jgi:lysophospholipase L1-like esterase
VEVVNAGVSGETTREIAARLPALLAMAGRGAGGAVFDAVVVLGGTNDLGYGMAPDDIVGTLGGMRDAARAAGCRVVMCTVPECRDGKAAVITASRAAVNAAIRAMASDAVADGAVVLPPVAVADVAAALPYHACDDARRAALWDDGLHFKPAGYDEMGAVVAGAMAAAGWWGLAA